MNEAGGREETGGERGGSRDGVKEEERHLRAKWSHIKLGPNFHSGQVWIMRLSEGRPTTFVISPHSGSNTVLLVLFLHLLLLLNHYCYSYSYYYCYYATDSSVQSGSSSLLIS